MTDQTTTVSPPSPPPPAPGGPSPLRPLQDCSPCDGRGVMTARSTFDLHGAGAEVPCPACDGQGGFVVVRDLQGRL